MATVTVKGEIGILIDINETEARLAFKPGPAAREWSVERVGAIVGKRGIPSVGRQVQEAFLNKAAAATAPFAVVIARGVLPEPAIAEGVDWLKTPIPSDLQEAAEMVLAKAPPPSADDDLPAGATGKAAGRDMRVLGTSFVKAGQMIGTALPARLGKNGKNVFGRVIPAPRPDGIALSIDPSIAKIGKEYFAGKDGILRWGNAWADIVAFRASSWELSEAEDGSSVALAYDPGDPPGPVPDAKAVLEKASGLKGGKGQLIDAATLHNVLARAAAQGKPFRNYYLTLDSDSRMEILVSDDKMKATLNLAKPKGRGKPISLQELSNLLKVKGVKPGDPNKLRDDVNAFLKSEKTELAGYLLAEGKPAGKSADRSAKLGEAPLAQEGLAALRARLAELQAGYADLKGLDEYPLLAFDKAVAVQKGKACLTLTKADQAQAGVDVSGKAIPPAPGACPTIKCYDNVAFQLDAATPLVSGMLLVKEADGVIQLRALPFRDPETVVKAAEGGVVLSFDPGEPAGAAPDAKAILEKAKALDKANSGLVAAEILQAALDKAAAEHKPLSDFYLTLDADSRMEIIVSPDKMKATLTLAKPKGRGRPIDLQELNNLVKTTGVKPRDPVRLKDDVNAFLKGAKPELKDYVLAEGRPAGKAADRSAKLAEPFVEAGRLAALRKRLGELADYYADLKGLDEYPLLGFEKICEVQKGKAVLAVSKAEQAQPGLDVLGAAIPPVPGKGPTVKCYDNLAYQLDAATPLVSGLLLYKEAEGVISMRVLPFREPATDIVVAPDGSSLLFSFDPGEPPCAAPDAKAILERAKAMDKAGCGLVAEEPLRAAIASAVADRAPIKDFILTLDSDSRMEVVVSEDKMKATLSLAKAKGRGKPISLQELSNLIKLKGVKPRDPNRLRDDLNAFIAGPKPELRDYVLAEGRPAGKTPDRTAAVSEPFLAADKVAALKKRLAELEAGLADLKGLDEYPLMGFDKACQVQEGKAVLSVSKADQAQAGVDVSGNAIPPIPGSSPVIKCYDNVRFSADAATPLVTGVLLYREAEGVVSLRALAFRDAEVSVSISPDEMSAEVSLFPGLGIGTPLGPELVAAALKAAGVVAGIDQEAVLDAIERAEASKTGKPVKAAVASGKPPRAPSSRRVDWQVRMASGKAVTVDSSGQADYRNQDKLTTVKEGEVIAVLHKQDDQGEAGQTVRGKKVEIPKAANDGTPQHDATVREEPGESGYVKLVASKTGQLSFEKNVLSITAALGVKGNIDMKTGNLRFPGNVSVSGSVSSGFQLVSGGDVAIGEGAEDSYVSAEGSVRMALGIRGRNRGIVKARKSIELLFAENAALLATEDIVIKNACVSCKVKTNGKLRLTSDKGKLFGGEIRARNGIEVQSLGSESNVATLVSFGQDYLILEQLDAERREVEKVKLALIEFDRRMREAEKANDPALPKLRQDKAKLLKILEKRQVRFWFLDDKFEAHFPSEVRVRGTVYPGVVIESHNRRIEVRQEKTKVRFYFDSNVGKLLEAPL